MTSGLGPLPSRFGALPGLKRLDQRYVGIQPGVTQRTFDWSGITQPSPMLRTWRRAAR